MIARTTSAAQSAQPRLDPVRLVDAGHVPDRRERPAQRERHAQPGPERAEQADRQREAVAGQRLDLVGDLVADHGDPGDRRIDHVLAQRRVVVEHEPEHGHEREQQREQREEGVEGDQGREVRRAVLAELLRHRDRETGDRVSSLPGVDPRDEAGHS